MYDTRYVVLLEDFIERLFIEDVELNERHTFPRNLLNTTEALVGRVRQVVNDNTLITSIEKLDNTMAANVACSTSDEDRARRHLSNLLLIF